MDNKIKEKIDNIFKTYGTEGDNAICIDLYHDRDYGTVARQCDWEEYIGDFSYEQKISKAPEGFPNPLKFVNLGLDQEEEGYDTNKESKMITDIGELCFDINKMVDWEESDFNGDVNQFWFAMVIVTSDYKVVEVLSDYSSAIYDHLMADISKMKSQEEEVEKLALDAITEAAKTIKENFKKVKSDEGKSKVFDITEKLQQSVSLRPEGES